MIAPDKSPDWLAWRKEGLLWAAKSTGLKVQIPHQPLWSEEDVCALTSRNSNLTYRFTLSWLGHLNAIRKAMEFFSTSLIIEDDAEWDVQRRLQIPQIAASIVNVSIPTHHHGSFKASSDGEDRGVLWLGHCGDSIPFGMDTLDVYDPTVPPYIHSWEKRLSPNPHNTRWIYHSTGPICTYTYALTKASAEKILEQYDHGSMNFDIWLHSRCKTRELRCFTVNPELFFHHHEVAGPKDSLINGPTSKVIEEEITDNIWHSARCNRVVRTEAMVTCMGPKPDVS